MHYTHHYESPLGTIVAASNGNALIGLWFEGQKYYGATLGSDYVEVGPVDARLADSELAVFAKTELADCELADTELAVFAKTDRWLDIYFSGKDPGFIPPLALKSTDFRMAVWEILLGIPYGGTMTYGQIAAEIARTRGVKTMSAQAVGGAVGHNPISLIVPCHRVVGADGSLTGYAGGVERKRALLEMERGGRVR